MRAIIFIYVLLQLSLITPNPDPKIKPELKESEVIRKRNLSNKRRLDFSEDMKSLWEDAKDFADSLREKLTNATGGFKDSVKKNLSH